MADAGDGGKYYAYVAGLPGSWNGLVKGIYRKGNDIGLMAGTLSGTITGAALDATGSITRGAVLGSIDPGVYPVDAAMSTWSAFPLFQFKNIAGGLYTYDQEPAGVLQGYTTTTGRIVGIWGIVNYGTYNNPGHVALSAGDWSTYTLGAWIAHSLGLSLTDDGAGRTELNGQWQYMDTRYRGVATLEYRGRYDALLSDPSTGPYRVAGTGDYLLDKLAFTGEAGSSSLRYLYRNNGGLWADAGQFSALLGSLVLPWSAANTTLYHGGSALADTAYSGQGLLWNGPVTGYDIAKGSLGGAYNGGLGGGYVNGFSGGIVIGSSGEKSGTLASLYLSSDRSQAGFLTGTVTTTDLSIWMDQTTLTKTTPAEQFAGLVAGDVITVEMGSLTGKLAGTISGSPNGSMVGGIPASGGLTGHFVKNASTGLPWGIYSLKVGGTSSDKPAAAGVLTATIGGSGPFMFGEPGEWLGMIGAGNWSAAGELSGNLAGSYLTLTTLGTFAGPFSGIGTTTAAGSWIGQSVGTYSGTSLAFGSRLGGHIAKVLPGSINGAEYTGLYKLLAGEQGDYKFLYANGNQYLNIRYEDMYFRDNENSVNKGARFEEIQRLASRPDGFGNIIYGRNTDGYWYLPDDTYTHHSGGIGHIADRGKVGPGESFPNLDLSAAVTSGAGGTHPHFPGTTGDPLNFPSDYNSATQTGTFVPTFSYTYGDASSLERLGSFTGLLGGMIEAGKDKMYLWTTSAPASTVSLTFLGAYSHDAAYTAPAYQGTLGFGTNIGAYVDAGGGFGGAYFGFLAGNLPDAGSTVAMEGNLYALYLSNTAGGDKAGIMTGALTAGAGTTSHPEIGMWKGEGTIYRIAGTEVVNGSGVSFGGLIDPATQSPNPAGIFMGRAGIDGTAGMYNPAGVPLFALGSGYGWSASIKGLNDFGLFSLRHGFMNRFEDPFKAGVTWETAGWAELGQYGAYNDFGYWYAALPTKSWASGRLSGDISGEFLTLKKWGMMTGKTLGSYEGSTWQASSLGYWTKSQDLAFANEIKGRNYDLRTLQNGMYTEAGGATYSFWYATDTAADLFGGSDYTSGAATTVRQITRRGPDKKYFQETWATTDSGATWSYQIGSAIADADVTATLSSLATRPGGSWTGGDNSGHELRESAFSGIMGGINTAGGPDNLWIAKTSDLKLRGAFDFTDRPQRALTLSTGDIASINPLVTLDPGINSTSPIDGAYKGAVSFATDSANAISGGVMALYGKSGAGGVLFSDNIAGIVHPGVGAWEAAGTIEAYEMAPALGDATITDTNFAGKVRTYESINGYPPASVSVTAMTGGTIDLRSEVTRVMRLPGEPWGIWDGVAGGSYAGATPETWASARESTIPQFASGGTGGGEYLNVAMGVPAAGLATGTAAGAKVIFDDPAAPFGTPSYTVVMGGIVKGLFDPATTPMTWSAISRGGFMETNAFLNRTFADDAARANFEKAMKVPAFDVGTASLQGNDTNLYVKMDNIKFFRFQTEAAPRIWATKEVAGSYTTNPSPGTQVQLTSSGDLAGLKHTFEVKQWNTGSNSWGASLYRSTVGGTTDAGGTLTRGAADAARPSPLYLPAGAPATVPISEMRGGAAGAITPGANTTGLPGPNSFSGTGAGTVR